MPCAIANDFITIRLKTRVCYDIVFYSDILCVTTQFLIVTPKYFIMLHEINKKFTTHPFPGSSVRE